MRCSYCKGKCIKKGKTNKVQRYQCKECKKYQQRKYSKRRIPHSTYQSVLHLNNEGSGISEIGRLEHISKSVVQRIIERLTLKLNKPVLYEENECYEMDELCTYCGNKGNKIWLIYAINRKSRKVVDFCVGARNRENLTKVLKSLLSLNPKYIYTDKLNLYDFEL